MANFTFQYSAQFFTSIERTISKERLNRYVVAAHGDPIKAIQLYEYNVAISEALYGYLHGCEIAFRNAIHHELTNAYNTSSWYDRAPLSQYHKDKIQEAKNRVRRNMTAGKVIAELSFSFWAGLFAKQYLVSLWSPYLWKVFPNTGLHQDRVFMRLETITHLRNRIAHHERIITSRGRLWAGHRSYITLPEISECAEWICLDTAQWLKAQFRYQQAEAILLHVRTMGVNLV